MTPVIEGEGWWVNLHPVRISALSWNVSLPDHHIYRLEICFKPEWSTKITKTSLPRHSQHNPYMICWHKGAVPAATILLKLTHPYSYKPRKKDYPIVTSLAASFTSHPPVILGILHLCFYWALIAEQPPDLRPNTSRRHLNDTERPEWQCHRSSCHAFLTSFTAPPFSYTQNHGVHFQTESGLKARRSYEDDIRWTVPSLLDWTTILPAGLLKTEPPIDATRRLIILHPVATTTPHNVSGNAACRHALS